MKQFLDRWTHCRLQCFQNNSLLTASRNCPGTLCSVNVEKSLNSTMNNQINDPEMVAKRLRFETKYLRKRFPFRSAGAPAEKRQDIRDESDQNLATPTPTGSHHNCRLSEHEVKVGEGPDDTMLERFVFQHPVCYIVSNLTMPNIIYRLAVEELLQEAAKGKVRADIGGPSEWRKKAGRVNKRFVANSLLQMESQNKRKSRDSNIKE